MALTAEARTILERERLAEEEVAECDNFLSRALSHWPANTEALELQRRTLLHHIKLAQERRDLRLARILALRLPPSDERAQFLEAFSNDETQFHQSAARKRYALMMLATVLLVMFAFLGNLGFQKVNDWKSDRNRETRTYEMRIASLASQLERVSGMVQVEQTSPTDKLRTFFGNLMDGLDGPIPLSEQRRLVKGTPLKIICLNTDHEKNKKVHITGNIPDLGQWTPNKLAFDYVGENSNGNLWSRDITYQTMDFKLTYGETGSDWEGTEEWTGPPNRTLPSANAALYRDSNGNLILFCVYGVVPGTDY